MIGNGPLLTALAERVCARFFVDRGITSFVTALIERYATPDEWATLLPSHAVAARCVSFFQDQCRSLELDIVLRIIDLIPCADPKHQLNQRAAHTDPIVSAVMYPKNFSSIAKSFWQHTGEGISSRRAELCHRAFIDGFLVPGSNDDGGSKGIGAAAPPKSLKGPRRYQKGNVAGDADDNLLSEAVSDASVLKDRHRNVDECAQFVEERYGRNLDFSLAGKAKLAIRKRIAGGLTADIDLDTTAEAVRPPMNIRQVPDFSEDDVYLYPSGMSSIFNTHRIMMACRGKTKSVCFGLVFVVKEHNALKLT